jgi:hypothetical protein
MGVTPDELIRDGAFVTNDAVGYRPGPGVNGRAGTSGLDDSTGAEGIGAGVDGERSGGLGGVACDGVDPEGIGTEGTSPINSACEGPSAEGRSTDPTEG